MTDDGRCFAELLRAGRRAAGFNQRQLADRAGVSLAAIRDLEQGRTRRPRRQILDALLAALRPTGDDAAAFRVAAGPSDGLRPATMVDPSEPVRVRILGPLCVRRGLAPVPVGGGRRRALLGRLALSANAAVPLAELIDVLWDTEHPAAPRQAVQPYLSRLRSALKPAGPDGSNVLSRTGGGYQLNLADEQLDLLEFRRYVDQARVETPDRALDLLESALRLWRGSPLGDVPGLHHHPLVTALANERIAATLRHADLAIGGGQVARCLPLLLELAGANPLHEPLHARLIAALAANDLQAAALEAYAEIRRRLVDDLGVEPGPELRDTHRRVLRQEPAGPVRVAAGPGSFVPAQLPLDVFGFTGRETELVDLDRIAEPGVAPSTAVVIAVVSGTAGVGKTALAVRWAHRARSRFPDGQVYLDLHGYDADGPMSSADALHRLLSSLGVPDPEIPAQLDERAACLRTQVADRRLLIVLDNASSVEQVRPLLPGTGPCTVLVTSRDALTGLVALHGAHRLDVGLLSAVDAAALLSRLIGDRAEAEPGAVGLLADQCARLPLALRVAAERIVSGPPATLTELTVEMADRRRRLELLDVGGDLRGSVRAVFSWSTRHLPDDAVRVFALLGLHPGADFDPYAVAALADISTPHARERLATLVHANLIHRTGPDRYGLHDLLRAYAAERAGDERPDEVRAALTRLFDYYLDAARLALYTVFPAESRRRPARPPVATMPVFTGDTTARAWLDTESTGLSAITAYAATHGWAAHAARLAETLHSYRAGGHAAESLIIHGDARVARQIGDVAAVGRAGHHLGADRTADQLGVVAHRLGEHVPATTTTRKR